MIDGANRNRPPEDDDQPGQPAEQSRDDIPPKPDATEDPIGSLRWELTHWPDLMPPFLAPPRLSEEEINEACLKLAERLEAERVASERTVQDVA